MRFTLEDNGFRDVKSIEGKTPGDWTLHWQVGPIKRSFYEQLNKYQKVNHFPFSYYLTRKDLMYRAISKLREMHGQRHFSFVPKTYIVPQEYMYLEDEMRREPHRMWICKPAASSQGRGITVTN